MKTGFAKVCINPPYGAPITGYYNERYTKGILDSIYARCTAFDDGEQNAFVLALDVCFLPLSFFEQIKDAIIEATGCKREAIFINCSHTHTGPLLGDDFGSGMKSDPMYDAFLIASCRDAAVYALDDLAETKAETANAEAKNISFVRRYRMRDGSVATNPGVNNPNIDHALGTPNETVKLLKLVRENADDIFIVSFGTHPDSVGGEYISADYMGFVCSILENAVPNTKCMFLLAPQGDVNHVNVHPTKGESAISEIDFDSVPRSHRHAEHMGRIIAGAVLSVCSITEEVKLDKISCGFEKVDLPSYQENHRIEEVRHIYDMHMQGRADELPYKEMELTTVVAEAKRIMDLENGPESYPFYISAIRMGELCFAGIGGEPFTELGNRIVEGSPFPATLLCCLTNNVGGYIPNKKAYAEGGYEARSSHLAPGGDDIIVEGTLNLLHKI